MRRPSAVVLALLLLSPAPSGAAGTVARPLPLRSLAVPLSAPMPVHRLAASPLPSGLPSAALAPSLNAPSLAPAAPLVAAPVEPLAAAAEAPETPKSDLSPEEQSAAGARRFDQAAPREDSESDAVPSASPAASSASGLAPAAEEKGSFASRRIPDLPNERPFLLRHYRWVKAVIQPFLKLVYPVVVTDAHHIPKTGPVIIVANHTGYIDPLLLAYAAGRPVRFMMFRGIYEKKPMKWFYKGIGAIPVGAGESRELIERAMGTARAALRDGEVVVIFPEGKLTHTGGMDKFKRGFENLARETGAPVIPAHIDGVWGSVFSRREDFRSMPQRILAEVRRRTAVRFGPRLEPGDAVTARQVISELGADAMEARIRARGKTLAREFFASAKRRWSLPALSDSTGRELDYGDALTEAVLLGQALDERLTRTPSVGVWLPASADAALANLALTLRGRVPVNLSVAASPGALAQVARVASIDAVVTSRRFAAGREALPRGTKVVYIEDLAPAPWKKAALRALLRVLPRAWGEALFARRAARGLDETAAILFTGGASGQPKGVELTHLNLRANSEMIREAYSFRPNDVILGTLPLFHSFGFAMTLWTPLLKGISVAYHADPLDLPGITEWARRARPTVLLGTPTLLRHYLEGVPADALPGMRLVAAGAERLPPELAEAFSAKFGIRPQEGYGATELSPVASVNVRNRGPQEGGRVGTVGQPIPGQAMRVVDPVTFELLPPEREGLLLVKGANVMKGYVGDPRLTASVLRDGWYVTGDIAVMHREGFVTWVRRAAPVPGPRP